MNTLAPTGPSKHKQHSSTTRFERQAGAHRGVDLEKFEPRRRHFLRVKEARQGARPPYRVNNPFKGEQLHRTPPPVIRPSQYHHQSQAAEARHKQIFKESRGPTGCIRQPCHAAQKIQTASCLGMNDITILNLTKVSTSPRDRYLTPNTFPAAGQHNNTTCRPKAFIFCQRF